MLDKVKRLGKDYLIYGIGTVVHSGINFAMIPIYSRAFKPEEYALIDLLVTLSVFLGMFAIAGMDTAMSFFYYEKGDSSSDENLLVEKRRKVISNIFLFKLVWGLLLVAVGVLSSDYVNKEYFYGRLDFTVFFLGYVAGLALEFVNQNALVFRLKHEPWKFVIIISGQTLSQALLIYSAIYFLNLGIYGYFLGYFISTLLFAIISSSMIREYLQLRFDKQILKSIIKFSLPLFFSGIALYVLNSSDRLIISKLTNLTQLGIYSIGARFSLFMMLFIYTFRQAWTPLAMEMIHSEQPQLFFQVVSRLYLGFTICLVLILTAFSKVVIYLFSTPEYSEAYSLIGVLGWIWIFYGLFAIVSVGIVKSGKNYWATYTMILTAIINVVLNYLFIPKVGIIGAGIATSISFLIWVVFVTIVSERLWRVNYPIHLLSIQIIIGAIANYYILHYLAINDFVIVSLITIVSLGVLIRLAIDKQHLKQIIEDFKLSRLSNG